MPSQQSSFSVDTRLRVKEPDLFDVLLLNDDFTTMEFVVDLLCTVFSKSYDDAERIMLSVHNKGAGVAGTYTFDIAKSKASKAEFLARQNDFPLRLKVKAHE